MAKKTIEDMLPNVSKTTQRARDGSPVERAVIAPPTLPMTTMRIRILRSIHGSRSGTFLEGQVYDMPIGLARSWIQSGLAEEDKMLDAAPETK